MKPIRLIALIVLAVAGVSVYLALQPAKQPPYSPSKLRVGVLPDQNSEILRTRFSPLLDYLAEGSGVEIESVAALDYSHLLQLFRNKEVDMARFGGLGFVQANTFYGAEPLVMRDIDTRFVSWFLVRENSSAKNLEDMSGKPFSFGSRLSTSGHIMPRHFLETSHKIIPEKYFSEVQYTNAHDQTVYSMLNNEVDIIAVNPVIVKAMLEDGRLKRNTVRILWETPPYPDYVWAINSALDHTLKTQLRNTFLALDPANTKHKKILDNLGSSQFLPAGVHDFKLLREIAASLGLLDAGTQ